MIEFALMMMFIAILSRIKVGEKEMYTEKRTEFDTLEDYMEYAELKRTGWRGDIDAFYKWKEE